MYVAIFNEMKNIETIYVWVFINHFMSFIARSMIKFLVCMNIQYYYKCLKNSRRQKCVHSHIKLIAHGSIRLLKREIKQINGCGWILQKKGIREWSFVVNQRSTDRKHSATNRQFSRVAEIDLREEIEEAHFREKCEGVSTIRI